MEYTKNLTSYIRENYTAGDEVYHLRDIIHDFSYTSLYKATPKSDLTTRQIADLLSNHFDVGTQPKQIKKVKYTVYVKNLRKIS
jgi:hypothetical protein